MDIFYLQHKISIVANSGDTDSPTRAFELLEAGNDVRLCCPMRELVKAIHQRYIFVKAAGGIVHNNQGERLIIHREGMWDLPKGMVEPNESLSHAALREVAEETGQHKCSIIPTNNKIVPLTKTYHIYNKYGGWHLKQTTWFPMISSIVYDSKPQLEENIDLCLWMDANTWKKHMDTSFPSLHTLIKNL